MNCPNCKIEMQKVKTESHYGAEIDLDQCPECGGLWFDSDEVISVKFGNARNFDKVDTGKLVNLSPQKKELFCPKDHTKLEIFRDPNFPASLKVESCPTCGGFWFNRGEFESYQEDRIKWRKEHEKEAAEVDDKFNEQIKSLLKTESSGSSYESLGKLGNFLSTPVYMEGLQPKNPETDKVMEGVGMAINIIQILLRLFLPR